MRAFPRNSSHTSCPNVLQGTTQEAAPTSDPLSSLKHYFLHLEGCRKKTLQTYQKYECKLLRLDRARNVPHCSLEQKFTWTRALTSTVPSRIAAVVIAALRSTLIRQPRPVPMFKAQSNALTVRHACCRYVAIIYLYTGLHRTSHHEQHLVTPPSSAFYCCLSMYCTSIS